MLHSSCSVGMIKKLPLIIIAKTCVPSRTQIIPVPHLVNMASVMVDRSPECMQPR